MKMATPHHTPEIRSVSEHELQDVLNVYRACEDFLALGSVPHASMNMVLKDIDSSRREGGRYCGIYSRTGQMIGVVDYVCSGFRNDPRLAYFSLLILAPPFRQTGLGTCVVQLIEAEMQKQHGVTTVLTYVQVNNSGGLQFWTKRGYRVVAGPEMQPDQTTVLHLQKNLCPYEETDPKSVPKGHES